MRFTIATLCIAISSVGAQRFNTPGKIQVYNTTDWRQDVPESARLGCVSDTGRLTANDCGTFRALQVYPWTLYTAAGNCSFEDPNEPLNSDSFYGKTDHAFHCYSRPADIFDSMYSLVCFIPPWAGFSDNVTPVETESLADTEYARLTA